VSVLAPPRGGQRIFTVNPVAKIAAIVPLTLCLLLSLDWVSALVGVLGELVLFAVAGLTMVLYGRPSGATYVQLGFVHVTEGSLAIGLATTLRLVAIALPAVVLFATIDPTDLADGLAQRMRLPSRFVLGALAGLRLVGLFVQDWRSLELARRARGVADTGRVRRLLGQALALLVLAIRRGTKLATAMEARAFDGPAERTWARPSPFGAAELLTVACGLLLGALCLGAALAGGTWNFILS